MAVPDLAAARRAAQELVGAGAGRVLVFGSVARGEATEDSDIDLVAVFDDLGDYSTRAKRRCALEAKAREAAGCPVDVMVTDAPEWAVRTTKVPCSVEARVVGDAVVLADAGSHARIDWDKEIGLPADPAAELESRFSDMSRAVLRLKRHLRPDEYELAAIDDGDPDQLRQHEGERFASAMTEVLAVIESAAKITHIRPELPSEDHLRAHCDAALDIAAFAADSCRSQGVSGAQLNAWDQNVRDCNEALAGAVRHRDAPRPGT